MGPLSSNTTVSGDQKPSISIVVPTFNRAQWLGEALQSLMDQRTDGAFDYEIVVVDNASTDDTPATVAEAAAHCSVPVTYSVQSKPGDAPARNAGLQRARGTWIAFFDDDQLAEPDWLHALWSAAVQRQASIVGGPVHLDLPDQQLQRLGPICRAALRETVLYRRIRPYARRHLPGTGNALVERKVFDAVGNFDESMTHGGSDCDFFSRAREQGWALIYAPRAVIRHRVSAGRLSPEFFRWDALSGGAEHAGYFGYEKHGAAALILLCAARLAWAAAVHVPLLAMAWLRGDPGGILGRRTRLWRVEGYLRKTLAILAPKLFPQPHIFESFDLRKGRSFCR